MYFWIKDAHRENASSNKTPVLTKSMNMAIWEVGTSNHLFIRCYLTKSSFSKK